MAAAQKMQTDVVLATAINDGDRAGSSGGWRRSREQTGVDAPRRADHEARCADPGRLAAGVAASEAQLQDSEQTPIGRLVLSVTTGARSSWSEARRLTEVGTRIDRNDEVLASSSRVGETVKLPDGQGDDVKIAGRDFRATSFSAKEPGGPIDTIRLFSPVPPHGRAALVLVDRPHARRSWPWRCSSR